MYQNSKKKYGVEFRCGTFAQRIRQKTLRRGAESPGQSGEHTGHAADHVVYAEIGNPQQFQRHSGDEKLQGDGEQHA